MSSVFQTLRKQLPINLLANFIGSGWSAILGLLVIPFYIQRLGVEAYGVIGFYIALQTTLQILDFGLSPTMSREMARYSIQPDKAQEARNLVRTLEIGYWLLGVVIGCFILGGAGLIAEKWLNAEHLSAETLKIATASIGVLVILQWPVSFYQSGLMGLQKQVLANTLLVINSTLRHIGAVIVLWLFPPTLITYFLWQIIVSTFQISVITLALWRSLPRGHQPDQFQFNLLRNIQGFALGMSGITLSSLILTQADKIILSKTLSLEGYGYYMVASTVNNGLALLVLPVFSFVFPRLSALAVLADDVKTALFYHRSEQTLTACIFPIAGLLIFFPVEILWLWTGDLETAQMVAPIVRPLILGSALNAAMTIPYALQLAHNWTRIVLAINVFFILTLVPIIIWASAAYGALGAAFVWAILNTVYIVIGVPLTHSRLLKGETKAWFLQDVLPVGLSVIAILIFARALIPPPTSRWDNIGSLMILGVITAGAAMLSSQHFRTRLQQIVFRRSEPTH